MKNLALLISLIIVFYSCEDGNNLKYMDATPGGDDDVALISCSDAVYPPQEQSEYNLPYPIGKTYLVNLNHCSTSYHSPGSPDQFAVDFDMPIGSVITAARSGTVVYVEESGMDGGFPNNAVAVRHSDGTHAIYMHLTHEGAAVEVGFGVGQGQLIGYSGNTGLAGYPHLHFVVTQEELYPYASIPYNFKNTIENPTGPVQGVLYEALPN